MRTRVALGGRLRDGAGRLYEALPQGVVDVLGLAHPLLALMTGVRLPVAIAGGRCAGTSDRASVLVAGAGPGVDYFLHRFFDGPVELEPRGSVSVVELPGCLRRLRDGCDLTIARVDRISSRALFGPEYFRLPDWLGGFMRVPDDVDCYVRGIRGVANDMRRIHRNELCWHVSREPADFECFYHTMYRPFAYRRHGVLAEDRNVHQMRRVFRAGRLLWVTHRAKAISAILLMARGKVLQFVVLGTSQGSVDPIKLGGLAALYLFSLRYAAEQKFTEIDFGGVRPCLTDGVVRNKQKWGMSLRPKRDVYHDFLVHWPRLTDSVTSFLWAHPLVCCSDGGIFGLTAPLQPSPDGSALARLRRRVWISGLRRVYVLGGREPAVAVPPELFCIPVGSTQDCDSAAVARAVAEDLRGGQQLYEEV